MKALKRKLKRFLLYLSAFVAVMTLTAGFKVGVFFITRTDSGENASSSGNSGIEIIENNALTEVLSNIMAVENASFVINLNVLPSDQKEELKILANAKVSLIDEENPDASILEKLKLSLCGNIEFSSQKLDFNIDYLDGFIFANIGEAKIKIQTENIKDDLNKILSLSTLKKFNINLSLPDFSEFSFDPSMIAMIASGLTENETSDGKEIKFNLLGYGEIVLITDNDYVLKNVKVDNLEVENTKIGAFVDANLKEPEINIVEPENKNEFTDFVGMINIIDYIDNFVDDGLAQGKINLNVFNQNLIVDYVIDFSNFDNICAKFRTNICNKNLILAYQNNKLFVSINDYKYFVETPLNFNKIIESLKYYFDLFGKQIPQINTNELKTKLESLDLGTILSFVNDIKITEDALKIENQNFNAEILIQNQKLCNFKISYKEKFDLDISLNEKIDEIVICENEFKNIFDEDLFNLLITSVLDNKTLAFDVSVNYKNININSILKVDLSNGRKFQLNINVLNKNLVITIIEDTIYVEIDKILKAKGNLSEIFEILKTNDILNFETIGQTEIKDFVLSLLSGQNDKINKILSSVAFNIIKTNNNIEKIEIKTKNICCYAKIIEFSTIEFDETKEYQNLKDLCNFVLKLKNVIETKTPTFEFVGSYKDYDLFGKIQYINNELLLTIQTKVLDKDLTIDLQDNTIYVDFDGLKIKCKLDEIQSLIEYFELTNKIDTEKLKTQLNLDEIVDNLQIDFDETKLKLAFKDILASIDLNNLKISLNSTDLTCEVKFTEQFNKQDKTGYIDLFELKDLLKATLKTLENKSISGKIDVVINLFGEDNHLDIDYAVQYENNELKGKIFTNFKGLNVNAYIDNKDIYLNIASIKVHFSLDEIDSIIAWINDIFETNIEFNLNDTFNVDKLKDIKLDFIKSIQSLENKKIIELINNFKIEVEFDEYISQINFVQNNKSATILCTDFESINFDELNKEDYKSYTMFTNLIDSTYNLIKSKQYSIDGEIKKYKNNSLNKTINISANVDITNLLNAYVDILGLDEQITVHYENKVLYFCYGGETGLKISIKENAVQEILSIACSAFNVDTKSIPYLDEFLSKENIDTGNLSSIMPKFKFSNPLSYLEYIEGFEVTDDYFAITIKAEKLGKYAKNKDVVIKLNYSNEKITSLTVNNLYVYGDSDEYIDTIINIKDFVNVLTVNNKNKYIDLSDSKDLIRAFVNTSNLNDYHIAGKVKLDIKLGDLEIKAATINVEAKIKLDENKKPIAEIMLTGYPLIGLVNNKNTNGVGGTGLGLISTRNRTILIGYKDGEFYLKTRDESWGAYKELLRTTKITKQTLFDNLSYYVQYLLGFTDSIQTKIDEAIQKSKNYTGKTDYGNIIEQYSKSGSSHTIKINLKELSHNDDIGSLTMVLTTLNNASTNNKDYIYRLDLDLRLLDDLMIIETEQSNSDSGLYLKDIGVSQTLSEFNDLMSLYINNKFAVDGEYEKEGSKSWRQENSGTRTVTFIYDGKIVSEQSGNIASQLTKPTMSNKIEDDGITHKEYKFIDWFLDEEFTNQFNGDTFTRYDLTLFAKYELVQTKHYATIHFETNEEVSVNDINGFVGDKLTLPILQNIEEIIDENNSVLKIFKGWKTLSGEIYTKNIIEHSTLTLYAIWEEKITKTFNLKIYSAGNLIYDGKVEAGAEFDFPQNNYFVESTKYYTTENFEESSIVTNFVISNHTVWYARNKYKITIISSYTVDGKPYNYECELYEKFDLSLTTFANGSVDNGSYTTEYTFNGYNLNNGSELIGSGIVTTPAQDAEYKANWTITEWCYVTFNVVWSRPSGWVKDGTKKSMSNVSNTNAGTNKLKIKRNTELVFSNYSATAKYNYKIGFISKDWSFKTIAWTTESAQNINVSSYSGSQSMTITQNVTLNPIWEAD